MSADNFKLDVGQFDTLVTSIQNLAKELQSLKADLDGKKNDLVSTWVGAGRNAFESKYAIFTQQFGDIKDDLFQVADDIMAIAEEYIQADVDLAKSQDGVTKRY